MSEFWREFEARTNWAQLYSVPKTNREKNEENSVGEFETVGARSSKAALRKYLHFWQIFIWIFLIIFNNLFFLEFFW